MKKFFCAIISLNALFSSYSMAGEYYSVDKPKVNTPIRQVMHLTETVTVNATTMCIGGYFFAVATQEHKKSYNGSGGVTMVQVFQSLNAYSPPQPVPCIEAEKKK